MPDETAAIDLGANGVNPDRHAVWQERRTWVMRARYVQIRVVNTEGRLRCTGIQVTARPGARSNKQKP